MKYVFQLIIILTVALAISGCSGVTVSTGNSGSNQGSSQGGNTTAPQFGVQTKTSGCQAHNALPDSACTPGAIIATATKSEICQPGYSR